MLVRRKKLKWRIARALAFGLCTTVIIAQIAAFGQDLTIHELRFTKNFSESTSPSYPADWVSLFEKMNSYELTKKWHGFIDLDVNLGLDQVKYFYTEYNLDPNLLPNRAADLERFRAGWPFKCLYWDHWTALKPYPAVNFIGPTLGYDKEQTERFTTQSGFRTGLNFSSNTRAIRRFPVAPFWHGLIMNTFFWGALWFIPGVLWRAIHTYRRKRGGHCLACGYAAEGLETCPECGTERVEDRG